MGVAEYFRGWLGNFPKEPADRMAMALAAVAAYEVCERKAEPTAADLQPLVVAASSSHKLVFETGGTLLARLAAGKAAAQRCLLQMAQDWSATARFHAVAYLDAELPEELRREIVGLALRDRSAKVRQKGIERAEEFRFTSLLAQLEEMQRTDPNEAVRRSLAFHIPLLRDGYRLERSDDGAGYYLTVRGPRSVGGPFIPNERYSEEFVRQEVARLQSAQPWE